MVKGMEHVAIFAADTKTLTDWYKDMFGLREVYNNGKGTIFLAFESGDMIEFCMAAAPMQAATDKTAGIRHLALAIDDDKFDAMVDKLKAANVEVITDVSVSPKGIKTFFFADPEGNISHLIMRPEPLV